MKVACSQCGHVVPAGSLGRCPTCDGILKTTYTQEEIGTLVAVHPGRGLDRYRPLLPVERPLSPRGEGGTPLLASRRIGAELGLEQLYFKLEGCNPSGSFKDRPAAVGAALALETGAAGILTASSGNAGSAIAAAAAAQGLPCVVLLEPGNPPQKTRQMLLYGAKALPVAGVFQRSPAELAAFLLELAEALNYYLAFVWAPVNPYLLEGIKSISYEVCQQLGQAPAALVTPVGGGDLLTAQWRGYLELQASGRIDRLPRMIAAQSSAAAPLLRAYEAGSESVPTLDRAGSVVSGINVSFSGDHALAAVRESQGSVVAIADDTIREMQARLAREEGVWTEPAGAAPVAAAVELARRGELATDEPVVCLLSGAGFKDAHLAEEEVEDLLAAAPIEFGVDSVLAAVLNHKDTKYTKRS